MTLLFVSMWLLAAVTTSASSFGATARSQVFPINVDVCSAVHHSTNHRACLFVRGGGVFKMEPSASRGVGSLVGKSDSSSPSMMGPKSSPPGWLRSSFPSVAWHKIPNYLTYLRSVAIPIFAYTFYLPYSAQLPTLHRHVINSSVFAVASFTDYVDGFLARRWDITSSFGAFLDPVVDKLMVSTALALLSGRYGPIIAIPTSIIFAREIAVSALREWMAQRGQRSTVAVGFQGKLKTVFSMISLVLLLLVPPANDNGAAGTHENAKTLLEGVVKALSARTDQWQYVWTSGLALLFFSTILTLTSAAVYFRAAAPELLGDLRNNNRKVDQVADMM